MRQKTELTNKTIKEIGMPIVSEMETMIKRWGNEPLSDNLIFSYLDNRDGTFDRKISALLKLSNVLGCKKLMVITRDFEQVLEIGHATIEIIPVWKCFFNL